MSELYTKDDIQTFIFTQNNKEQLKEAITSVLNQTIGDLTITVVDVGSCDGTGDLVNEISKENPNLKYIWFENEEQKVEIFKKAIELTTTPYVIMFHDKDIMHPDYIKFAIAGINKFPNTTIVSTNYQGWSNPSNKNWKTTSKRFDYCPDKKTFANYLYRMQRYVFSPTVYKTQNLKEHIYDIEYYSQFGDIGFKPFVANTMKDDDAAIIFRSKRLIRYRTPTNEQVSKPTYNDIFAFNRFFKEYMNDSLYAKFMYNLINYKQLKNAYFESRDFTISLKEFLDEASLQGASCSMTELSAIPYFGRIIRRFSLISRQFFKTKYKRYFTLEL